MNNRFLIIVIFVLVDVLSAFAGDYTIHPFTTGGRSIPQQSDEVMALSTGDNILKEVSSLQSLAPGEVIMRRRFSSEEYRLYMGSFTKDAFSKETNLFSFPLPAGMSIEKFSILKFYTDRATNPDNDIPTIYYDNTHAYVRIISRLYYNTGKWQDLFANNIIVDAGKAQPIGDITVTSTPPGARIMVDGEDKGVITPNYVTGLFAGQHRVSVDLADYQMAEKMVEVKRGETMNLSFDLLSALGNVEINSSPSGAKVTFNNIESGATPLTLNNLKPGSYTISLALDLYKPQSKQFSISMNKKEQLNITLEPDFGTLQLPHAPSDIQFAVDNKPVSSRSIKLNPGKHRISWSGSEEYSAIDTVVTISIGAVTSFVSTQVRLTGALKIMPQPRDAEVFVNGESNGVGAKNINSLPTGTYTVLGRKDGYQLTIVEAKVRSNETETVKLNLRKGKNKVPMVWIKGRTFMMGSQDDETTVHQVTLDGFYMGKYEVTQAEYEKVMGTNPSHFKGCPDCPVEQVSRVDAMEYCRRTGTRLPTEAEWEYACRGGTGTNYYWGNEMDDSYAWYGGNSDDKTHPVGQKKPNAYGLYDMSGNVLEWCSDGYDSDTSVSEKNPASASAGSNRVFRGGAWSYGSWFLRSSYRRSEGPPYWRNDLGFRVAL